MSDAPIPTKAHSAAMPDGLIPAKADTAAMSSTEKKSTSSNDDGLPPDVAALMEEFSGAKYNKLMRKMDMRLIPIVSSPAARGFASRVMLTTALASHRLPCYTYSRTSIGKLRPT